MTNKGYKLFTIVGNVATGKSTLTELLSEYLPAQKVPADEFYKSNPFFPLTVLDRKRWSFPADLWFLKERVKMAGDFDKFLERSHVVVDSGLPMTQVYTHSRLGHGYFTKDEWDLYQECYDVFTQNVIDPDVVIYLSAPVKVLRERIEKRGREFEVKYHDVKYLSGLSESLVHVIDNLENRGIDVVRIDATKVDFLANKSDVENLVKKLLN